LRQRYMFKVDGSKTHGIKHCEFLMQITSRNLVMFPYPPNATAFLQELDQLCFLTFKRNARKVIRLNLNAQSERPDFTDQFVQFVWAEQAGHAHNIANPFHEFYCDEDAEHFAQSTEQNPCGHHGFSSYAVDPAVAKIMQDIAARVDLPWGPVQLMAMLGSAIGAALLDPRILSASFDAVTEDKVNTRPLVKREQEFHAHATALIASKTAALANTAVAMSGNLATLSIPVTADLPSQVPVVIIPDEKWNLFCSKILRSEDSHSDMREACVLWSSFSDLYDEAHKKDSRVAAFHQILERADSADAHAASFAEEQQDARNAIVVKFETWILARTTKMSAIGANCANGSVPLNGYTQLLTCAIDAIPSVDCSNPILKSFEKQLKQVEKARLKVAACIATCRNEVAVLQQKILSRKLQVFPDISLPAPEDATNDFDSAAQEALQCASKLHQDLQQEVGKESAFEDVRRRIAALPAPVPRSSTRGRGRGRGTVRVVAASGSGTGRVVAATPSFTSESDEEQ
jgi:hypothetical protein